MNTKYKWVSGKCDFLMIGMLMIVLILPLASCKKIVDAAVPKTSLSQAVVYNSDLTAISVLTGIYQKMNIDNLIAGEHSLSMLLGLYSDEFDLSSAVSQTNEKRFFYSDSLFSNSIVLSNSAGTSYWTIFYNYIFSCNSAIEGLSSSIMLSPNVKNQLLGEARFVRAFLYFYLLNLYGDVPLSLSSDWQVNSTLPRSKAVDVYSQIIEDLSEAEKLLSDSYLDGSLQAYTDLAERVRPTKWAASAMLARVYFFTNEWSNAESMATSLINNSTLFSIPSLNESFVKNSREAIWQLQPQKTGKNTLDAELFLLPTGGPNTSNPVYLSTSLLSTFEMNDQRRFGRNWIDSVTVGSADDSTTYFFPYKYKAGIDGDITSASQLTEYTMILRLAEQYLIRAESRAHINDLSGAQSDLNLIRSRAGLPNIVASSQEELLLAIQHERQVEFFTELGSRWFDIKRTNKANSIMTDLRPLKAEGRPWAEFRLLFPVPISDIIANPNITQNVGY